MELGCDAVLMNTAIAGAQDPVLMAGAMKKAVDSGREAFRAGRITRKLYSGAPSSPPEGLISAAPATPRRLPRARRPPASCPVPTPCASTARSDKWSAGQESVREVKTEEG